MWHWFQDEEEDEDEEEAKLAALLAKRTKKLAKMQWKSTAAILVAFSWYFSPKHFTNIGHRKIRNTGHPPTSWPAGPRPTNKSSVVVIHNQGHQCKSPSCPPQWALSFSLSISCTYKMILPLSRIVAEIVCVVSQMRRKLNCTLPSVWISLSFGEGNRFVRVSTHHGQYARA